MIFDLTLLAQRHAVYVGAAFLTIYLLVGMLVYFGPGSQRVRRRNGSRPEGGSVYYGGAALIVVFAGISFFLIESIWLRASLLGSALITLIIGVRDERIALSAGTQLLWQFMIALVAVLGGWTIRYVSHPWQAGVIHLDIQTVGSFLLPGGLLTIIWLVFLMNAINWLDGVDGLASGVGVVALLTLALVSLLPSTQDRLTLSLSLAGAGTLIGFWLWNFPPARVYLGTSGSWFLGLYIGLVAIIGGGKIVTTLLVLALPVFDVVSVSVQRLIDRERPWRGDAVRHLHLRLQRAGWSPRRIALAGMAVSTICGIAALVLQTRYKLVAMMIAAALLAVAVAVLIYRQRRVPSNV